MNVTLRIPLGPVAAATDVVCFGENSLDFVGELEPGAAASSKRALTSFSLRVGGQMATAAVAVRRLGLRSTYIGVFGADEWGGRVRRDLAAERVETVAIVRPDATSRVAVVLVDETGDRQILEHRHPSLALRAPEVPLADCVSGRILLVDATNPAAAREAASHARARGIPTLVDADRVDPGTEALLEVIDLVVVPEPFVIEWAGVYDLPTGLEKMALRYPQAAAIVATRGPEGSLALSAGRFIETPGYPVAVTDTTGAGDAFRAGLAAGWFRHEAAPDLVQILRFANATAALNCRSVGAQAGLPAEGEVLALLNGRPT